MVDKVKYLLEDFRNSLKVNIHNTKIAPLRAERMLYDRKTENHGGVPEIETVLGFDADRTLAAEGRSLWSIQAYIIFMSSP